MGAWDAREGRACKEAAVGNAFANVQEEQGESERQPVRERGDFIQSYRAP